MLYTLVSAELWQSHKVSLVTCTLRWIYKNADYSVIQLCNIFLMTLHCLPHVTQKIPNLLNHEQEILQWQKVIEFLYI